MHHEKWIYSGQRQKHLIQLVHQFELNQISILLNGTILYHEQCPVTIEEDKSYCFFIDQELLELKIVRKNDQYVYQFLPHRYSTSLVGRSRKFQYQAQQWALGIALTLAVSFMLGISVLYFVFGSGGKNTTIEQGGMLTTATILQSGALGSHNFDNNFQYSKIKTVQAGISYKFQVNGKWYRDELPVTDSLKKHFLRTTGLPLEQGNEFQVLFAPDKPEINQLLLEKPSSFQLNAFHQMARDECLHHPPSDIPSSDHLLYCDCYEYYLYLQEGLAGLAQIYFQQTDVERNPYYNCETYQNSLKQDAQIRIDSLCRHSLKELRREKER